MFSSACLREQKEFLQVTWRQPYSAQEVCLIYDKGWEETAYSRIGRNSAMLLRSLHHTAVCQDTVEAERNELKKFSRIYKNISPATLEET